MVAQDRDLRVADARVNRTHVGGLQIVRVSHVDRPVDNSVGAVTDRIFLEGQTDSPDRQILTKAGTRR